MKYLGIWSDKDLKKKTHINKTTEKVNRIILSLQILMRNCGGPSSRKRYLLSMVANSILLYGAQTWNGALQVQKYNDYEKGTEKIPVETGIRI